MLVNGKVTYLNTNFNSTHEALAILLGLPKLARKREKRAQLTYKFVLIFNSSNCACANGDGESIITSRPALFFGKAM